MAKEEETVTSAWQAWVLQSGWGEEHKSLPGRGAIGDSLKVGQDSDKQEGGVIPGTQCSGY